MDTVPIFQIRRGPQDDWGVAAKWPNGTTEDVCNFANESEANEWIASELQGWLNKRDRDGGE